MPATGGGDGGDALPEAYRRVLQGVEAGLPDDELAELADVDPSAVPGLVRLALAKLLEARADDPSGAPGG